MGFRERKIHIWRLIGLFGAGGLLWMTHLFISGSRHTATSMLEDENVLNDMGKDIPKTKSSTKTVLFWTNFFGAPDARGKLGPKLFEGCPVNSCVSTLDRSSVKDAAAVLFHAFDIVPSDLPPPRLKNQHYVWRIGEPPTYSTGTKSVTEGYFDMIESPRLDSDVSGHYTYSVPLEKAPRNFAEGKTKLAAWFSSKCSSHGKRENLITQLQSYIQVDIYGSCGPLKCPRTDEKACDTMVAKDYKFYLAFENSVCQDYATEKIVRGLENYAVPVYLGGGNMTIFPSGSFIHVDDFSNARDLADFLLRLDKDDNAYNEYMKWRFDPVEVKSHGAFATQKGGWCQLCEHLNNPNYKPKGYRDVRKWYLETANCRQGWWE